MTEQRSVFLVRLGMLLPYFTSKGKKCLVRRSREEEEEEEERDEVLFLILISSSESDRCGIKLHSNSQHWL